MFTSSALTVERLASRYTPVENYYRNDQHPKRTSNLLLNPPAGIATRGTQHLLTIVHKASFMVPEKSQTNWVEGALPIDTNSEACEVGFTICAVTRHTQTSKIGKTGLRMPRMDQLMHCTVPEQSVGHIGGNEGGRALHDVAKSRIHPAEVKRFLDRAALEVALHFWVHRPAPPRALEGNTRDLRLACLNLGHKGLYRVNQAPTTIVCGRRDRLW